ncbi:MAG: sulfotransferase family protein [Alphaproteobacteria bacterium]|nr:sulfotransferase family protein [Alphaproteobacteria bacterium]
MQAIQPVETGRERVDLERSLEDAIRDPELIRAARALLENDLPAAEQVLRPYLYRDPTAVAAIRMMAELAGRLGRYADAEALLRRALALAPDFAAARANLATALYRQNRPAEAIEALDLLVDSEAENVGHQNLRAAAFGRLGSYEEAIALYEQVLARMPDQPKVWMSYGHVLKTVGRFHDGVAAYRRAIAIAPTLGEAWWSLANLKTAKLAPEDVGAMEAALEGGELDPADLYHLHFALGKATEDSGDPERAFGHYQEANRLRRQGIGYDSDEVTRHVARAKAVFTPDFFAARNGQGSPAADPIFILGMPRAGSTLIEQILASHPLVEGTTELPDMPGIARELGNRKGGETYPASLATLDSAALRRLGDDYLERARIQRRTDRPFFIDKMPNNWVHVGLIHLILPNARIIDARRHPLDCCVSNFRQHYARGQGFSYSLADMGRYYADYVELMAHFDDVLPGRVHRVIHEHLLDSPGAEIRRLLDHLGLAFDPACLAFHENDRPVRTASSEQVRRPLNSDGVGQWRPYAQWLGPLEAALGPVLDSYPEPPPQA